MITLTTEEQALVRFKVDSRVTEKDLPAAILNQLATEAEADLKLRLSTIYASLPVESQALYRSAVMNLTAAFAIPSVRPRVQQRAGPVAVQWASEQVEEREQSFRNLYESNVSDLIDQGHGTQTTTDAGSLSFARLY